ncbi:unnamed protein product, partial [Litomosoides sigmodontis]
MATSDMNCSVKLVLLRRSLKSILIPAKIRASDAGWPFPRSNEVLINTYISGTSAPPKIKPSVLREAKNEHSPIIVNGTALIVSADSSPGKVLGRVEAHDDDSGYAGLIRFSTFDEFFTFDPFTGEVILLKSLTDLLRNGSERKEMEYVIEMNACDWGQPVRCTDGMISVLITAANVHWPHFEKPYYRVRVAEDTEIGGKFLALLAEDSDYDDNGKVGYQVVNSQSHFRIGESTGVLEVMRKLDREERAIHRLTVMAFDHGHPMKVAFVNVTVIITDVNDNAPLCAEPFRKVIIPEDYPNNSLLTCLTAWDPDEGKNGQVVYAFNGTTETSVPLPFRVQEDTGCIFVDIDEPFDFETTSRYNLSVVVMDNGEPMLSSICTVAVELSDVNENLFPPLFDDIARETTVYENMPVWTEVLTLNAIDPDTPGLPVKYTIIDGDGINLFTIDSDGILRTSAVLDREACDSYWLTIEACDLNPIPLTSVLHVFVRVLDRNDHIPLSLRPIYFFSIPENSPENTVVVKVEAEDKDDLSNRCSTTKLCAAAVRFKIISGDPQSFFAIDSKTGYVVTRGKRRLDRETQKEHIIVVELCDQGDPKLCSTVPVVITVTDLNDNPPSFKQAAYNFNIPTGEVGQLCRIFAIDGDEGENARLLYNFTEADSRFMIDSDGGIVASESLKGNESYQMAVKASDMGQPSQTSPPVSITLNAVGRAVKTNGNGKPKLLHENRWARLSISDADGIGERIGIIEAEDPDGDQLWWKIIDGNPNNAFAISCDMGELYLAKSIDFIMKNITEVKLKFAVSDGFSTTEGMVLIEISRKHRSRPEFDVQHRRIPVSKMAPVGTVVHALKATIEQLNGSISDRGIIFGIHVVEDIALADKLRVNPSSGEVVIAEPLNNIVTNLFTLVVYARFNQMVNYALLDISLCGETKAPPKFVVSEYVTSISASLPVGATVLTVRAYDLNHSIIKYSIIEGNEGAHFAISEYSGKISTASPLMTLPSREVVTLIVQASIQQNGSLTDRCNVVISILNDDLGRITFSQSSYSLTIRKSTLPNTIVYVLNTGDANGIRYGFRDPCPLLAVHPISGVVSTKFVPDAESVPDTCTAVARNSLGTEDFMELKINVISANQHVPYFSNTVYQGYIHENMPLNSSVLLDNGHQLVVKAIDHDGGINGLVSYRIVSSFEPYFTVDFISGAVLTKAEIDFEKIKHWSFYVQASDSAPQMLTSPVPALVEIMIIDLNDMPPTFTQRQYNATLLLPTIKGVTVCYVTAEDIDTVGVLRYAIIASNESNLFSVEELTGRVYVNADRSADYAKNSYEVNLVVSDGLKSDFAILSINVQNTSQTESTVKFLEANYEAVIAENITSPAMVQLLTVSARSTVNGSVLYSILNPNGYFTISATSGTISWTGAAVDREKISSLQLIVQARQLSGGNERAQSIVTVRVEDRNDCEPHFIGLPYELTISRDARPGDRAINVKAIDADQGFNAVVRYKLKAGTEYFHINKYNGSITVSQSLEGANFDSISLEVIAEDQGEPSLSSSAPVLIHITDRSVPVFRNHNQEIHILENAAPGSSVLTVHAVCVTGGKIGYAIKSGNDDNRFKIDFDTGVISVRKALDREKRAFYNLIILAIDVTRVGVRAESYVLIEVDDVSDTAPRFTQLLYNVSVSEATVIGTQLLKVEAVDPDINDDYISYGIIDANDSVLSVNPRSGAISLIKSLDFETKRFFKFKLTATDSMQLTSETDLLLHVTDANDIAPRFIARTFHSTIESETAINQFVAKLDASDEDTTSSLEDDGKRFLFSLISGDESLLQIDRSTGVVSLLRAVEEDDLKTGEKHFNVSVSDGIFTDFCLLEVKIIRSQCAQRAPPRFERIHYSTSVPENKPAGTVVMTVRANNGTPPLKYSFSSCCYENYSKVLNIDEATGRIYTKNPLDYEAQRVHQFVVMVSDASDQRAFATLTLNVIDENDNTPQFVSSNIEASVPVDSRPGETVFMVFAFDRDLGDEVEYSVVGNRSKYFTIHPKQGLISVKEPLDDLVGEQTSLFIRATDGANPPHHNETSVILNISPAVHLPKFSTYHFLFSVPEDTPIGAVVGCLKRDSQLELPDVLFSLISMDYLSDFPFSVKEKSGEIVVSSALNYEKAREIRFLATMHSERQLSAKAVSLVTVRVTDVDDNNLRFENAHERVFVPEDLSVGSSITVVRAIDDYAMGVNSKIRYVLEKGNDNDTFKLHDETGWLTLRKKVDREVVEEYSLIIRAEDESGRSVWKEITVVIKDVNDSPPRFLQQTYSAEYFTEDLRVGQKLLQLQVHDPDLHPNNITKLYIISGNEGEVFGLDADTVVLNKLPPDSYSTEAHLLILAHDGKYTATAAVMVRLLSNISQFQCELEEITRNISEDSPPGSVIKVGYQGLQRSLRFYLTGAESHLFVVESNGRIIVRKELSSYVSDQIELFLRAETSVSLCVQRIIVNVERTSKGRVAFAKPVFYGFIVENSNASKEEKVFATRLEATVGDLDGIGCVTFKFANNGINEYVDLFDIDNETGVVTAISPLDREVKEQYHLSVVAITAAGHSAEVNMFVYEKIAAKVIIDVGDVNDNAPVFEQSTYHLRITEDEAVGKELVQLKAFGGDDKEVITYQVQASDDVAEYLSIDANSGMLKLASVLDFEKLEKFAITVVATDSGKPSLSSTCEVNIEILDVNDNPPRFVQPIYQATILENMQPGTKVVQVLANDPDSEHFGRVSYLITDDAAPFAVGGDGWITTTEMLDREMVWFCRSIVRLIDIVDKSTYRLTVKAIDGGTPPLSDSTTIQIDVEDMNDNAPVFKHCNITAVVQESVEPGHVILPMSITDNDQEPNTGPYKLEITGDGASLFAFDSTINLITIKRLPPHAIKEVYHLSVKVSDRGNLSTQCPMTLFVKKESRHAPQSNPLKITLNTLMGEFLGGVVGRVMATDEDKTDMLRYSLTDSEINGNNIWSDHQRPKIPFSIDSETGDVVGEADLLAGTYRFNVSITDGKYITVVPVVIDVTSIDQDALDHSVSIRIHNLLGEAFFKKHVRNFMYSLSRFLNVRPQNVQILSVQPISTHRHRHVRHVSNGTMSEGNLDILFTVSRTDSRGYHRPNFIRQKLEDNVAQLSSDIGIEIISVITEVCRRDVCANAPPFISELTIAPVGLVMPESVVTYRLINAVEISMCVPMNTNVGFDCICPPGSAGNRCDTSTCGKDKRQCSEDAEIGIGGDGFFHVTVANSVERRLELTINFRTTSTDAVIMHGAGNSDFHTIEVEKRYVQYRWNCGTGPGMVRINQQTVSDGKWHALKVSRRSRHVKLVLDGMYEKEGDSPPGSDVVNLYHQAIRLTFGALVLQSVDYNAFAATVASALKPVVIRGMVGCFGRISVDGYEIPKTKPGLYLYNTRSNCDAVFSEPCGTGPCENEGTCIPSGDKTYNCACPPRYSGSNCEVDLTPCASRPCPHSVECINLHNDFYCNCPHGFTGKTCQLRGDWDPCLSNPCGHFGSCIRLPHSAGFICNCSHGYSGTACKDRSPDLIGYGRPLNAIKIIGLIIVILLLIIVAALIVCIYLRIK